MSGGAKQPIVPFKVHLRDLEARHACRTGRARFLKHTRKAGRVIEVSDDTPCPPGLLARQILWAGDEFLPPSLAWKAADKVIPPEWRERLAKVSSESHRTLTAALDDAWDRLGGSEYKADSHPEFEAERARLVREWQEAVSLQTNAIYAEIDGKTEEAWAALKESVREYQAGLPEGSKTRFLGDVR